MSGKTELNRWVEDTDVQDEMILQYIADCGPEPAYNESGRVSLEIRNKDELVAALVLTEAAARRARSGFIAAIQGERSTEAKYFALGFRLHQCLLSQLLAISEQQHGKDWVRDWLARPVRLHNI